MAETNSGRPANNTTLAYATILTVGGADANQRTMQIPSDPNRIGFLMKNGLGAVQIAFGSEANSTNGYPVAISEILPMFGNPDSCPKGMISIYALATSTVSFIITSQIED